MLLEDRSYPPNSIKLGNNYLSLSVHNQLPAGIILSLVGVGILGINTTVVLDILEGEVHETTVAPVVTVTDRAVDQVLLAQRDKFSSLTEVLSLQSSSC